MRRTITLLSALLCVGLLSGCAGPAAADSGASALPAETAAVESDRSPSPEAAEPTPSPIPEPEAAGPDSSPSPEAAEPAPSSTLEAEEGGYFDGALFVGDSIMEGIRQYAAVKRQDGELLGTAKFLTSTMGVSLAGLVGDWESACFSYKGEEKPLADIVADIAPRRVFLLLGLNDLAGVPEPSVAETVERYARLLDELQTACPEVEFIIITNPPKVASSWLPDYTANRSFGNRLIEEFVTALMEMCRARDIPCVDAYASLRDENGALPDELCRDGYIHLNHQGAAVVVEALEAFAQGDRP